MPIQILPEESARIKYKLREELEKRFKDFGQDGFMSWLVDSLYEAGRTLAEIKERLKMGRGADF